MPLTPERLAELRAAVDAHKAKQAEATPPPAPEPTEPTGPVCPPNVDPKVFATLPLEIRQKVAEQAASGGTPINPPEQAQGLAQSVADQAAQPAEPPVEEEKPKRTRKAATPAAPAVDLAPVVETIKAIQPTDLGPVLEALAKQQASLDSLAATLDQLVEVYISSIK